MRSTKIISFDLDGTITDASFVDSVWLEGVPRLYALKKGLAPEAARKIVINEYGKVGRERLEWYDLSYWIEKFGLNESPEEILASFQHKIEIFPEVREVLEVFREKGFRMIIVTNARREFADLELEKTEIKHYFEHIFSSTSDFSLIKKTVDLYEKVCKICSVFPREMVHVGDDLRFDFEVPKALGIMAFYLDRTSQHSGESVIHSLKELSQKIGYARAR